MAEGRWSKFVPQGASNQAARVRDAIGRTADQASDRGREASESIRLAAAALPELVAGIEPPALPITAAWSVGLGRLLIQLPGFPTGIPGAVSILDRLGRLDLSPQGIGFDGEEAPWADITEIKFGPAADVLTSRALEHEIKRITSHLPPMPGRNWLVRRAVDLLAALCLAVTSARPAESPEDGGPSVPVAITYRKRLRGHEMTPGLFVALMIAAKPAISQAIASTAAARGITVSAAPPSRSRQHAATLRDFAQRLASVRGRPDDHMIENA